MEERGWPELPEEFNTQISLTKSRLEDRSVRFTWERLIQLWCHTVLRYKHYVTVSCCSSASLFSQVSFHYSFSCKSILCVLQSGTKNMFQNAAGVEAGDPTPLHPPPPPQLFSGLVCLEYFTSICSDSSSHFQVAMEAIPTTHFPVGWKQQPCSGEREKKNLHGLTSAINKWRRMQLRSTGWLI